MLFDCLKNVAPHARQTTQYSDTHDDGARRSTATQATHSHHTNHHNMLNKQASHKTAHDTALEQQCYQDIFPSIRLAKLDSWHAATHPLRQETDAMDGGQNEQLSRRKHV